MDVSLSGERYSICIRRLKCEDASYFTGYTYKVHDITNSGAIGFLQGEMKC